MGTQLPHLPDVERVSTSVVRILGGNPGKFTLQGSFLLQILLGVALLLLADPDVTTGTNTYLIAPPNPQQHPNYLFLDTGQGSAFPGWRRSLQQALAAETVRLGKKARITQCVLSHWHHDHVGGINELRQVCAEEQTSGGKETQSTGGEEERLKIYKYPLFDSSSSETPQDPAPTDPSRERENQLLRSANDDQDIGPIYSLHDGQVLQVGDLNAPDEESLKLQVVHTPGHTSDHIAVLIISSPANPSEVGTIFTGDAVLGHGTAVFEDLAQYMESLEKMKRAIEKITIVKSAGVGNEGRDQTRKVNAFPAHGAVVSDAKSKIEEYIEHRARREREVLNVLAGGSATGQGMDRGQQSTNNGNGWTPTEIVKVVYKDVPESLHIAAQGGVVQVLKKLEGEGRIEEIKEGGRWRIAQNHQPGTTNDNSKVEGPKAAL
jgi:endoribonuclease LACTB2